MAITQSQIDVCNSPIHNKKIRIEVLDNYFKIVSSIESEAVSGSISIDANNDCRRSCSLTVAVPNVFSFDSFIPDDTYKIQLGGKIWLDRNIKIWLGIQNLATEEYEWFNMGIYLIDEPIQTFGAETNTISFNGIDIIKRLDSTRGGQLASLTTTIPQYQDANNTVRTTLRKAFESVLLDLGNIEDYVISSEIDNPIWRYLPYDISVGAGETVYTLLCALRDIPSNWEMFFDENGTFVVQPIPKGADAVTVPITTGIVSQDSVVINFNNVKNQIIVYGGLNEVSKYTETIVYDSVNHRLKLYFDDFGWGNFNIGSKIGFKNLNEYNTFAITNVSIYVGTTAFASNIPIVGSENTTTDIPELFLEPDEIYVIRFMEGDVDSDGRIIGTNITFDLYSRQQPRYTAVDTNKESEFYINNYVKKPNYYGGQSKSAGFVYDITINDEDAPISSLPDNTYLSFMPNILTGSYQWKANSAPIDGSVATNGYTSIAYGNNMYVATLATAAYKSLDGGETWTQITGITISNSKALYWQYSTSYKYFVIAGNSTLYISTDLTSWTNLSSGYNYPSGRNPSQINVSENNACAVIGFLTGTEIFQLTNSSGTLVGRVISLSGGSTAIGSLGVFSDYNTGYVSDVKGQIFAISGSPTPTSSFLYQYYPDTTSNYVSFVKKYKESDIIWNDVSIPIVPYIVYSNNIFILFSRSTGNILYTSTDGVYWTPKVTNFTNYDNIMSVTYYNNSWIFATIRGDISITNDFTNWNNVASNIFNGELLLDISSNANTIIAVGNTGKLATSTDGATWTQRTSSFGTTNIYSVAYGNGLWVAIGSSGKLATSTDGVTWTQQTSSFGTTYINSVAYGNGLWVAVGGSGKLAISTDGTTWALQNSGFGTNDIISIIYGNYTYYICGEGGNFSASYDGVIWTSKTNTFSTNNIYSIGCGNGILMLGGGFGTFKISTQNINVFLLLSTNNIYLSPNIYSNVWNNTNLLTSPTYRSGVSYNNQLYLYGTDTIVGNFVLSSNNEEWSSFDDISRTFYNNSAYRLYANYLAPNSTKLVGIFSESSGGLGYFTEQVATTDDIVYRLLVYSSANSVTPLAEGEIVTKQFATLPYGKFTNDYSIQIVKYDKLYDGSNDRFIYQGVLNNYLQVDIGDDFENIPTDDLCRQRADYELYLHSNTNNSITLNIIPNYYLNVHNRISYVNTYKDPNAVATNYLIKSMTIPVTDFGTMTLTAIQLYD